MDWANPLEPVVTTVDEVSAGERPVLLVLRDEGHGGWQFYDGFDVSDRSPTIMPKSDTQTPSLLIDVVRQTSNQWQRRSRSFLNSCAMS